MFALIKDGIVVNIIVSDHSHINSISGQYEACIDIANMKNKPNIGDLYRCGRFLKAKV